MKLIDGLAGESPASADCPVGTVVISGDGAGDQTVGSEECYEESAAHESCLSAFDHAKLTWCLPQYVPCYGAPAAAVSSERALPAANGEPDRGERAPVLLLIV